jgi:uncharacterized membrane protein
MPQPQTISVSAVIEAPIWRVYQNWKRLDRFPAFVDSVKEARWLTPERLHWREEHKGIEHEIEYEVLTNTRESSLTWRSLTGPESSGSATIEPEPMGWSRITLNINFVPDSALQDPAAVRARHRDFLLSFKKYVESRTGRRTYD